MHDRNPKISSFQNTSTFSPKYPTLIFKDVFPDFGLVLNLAKDEFHGPILMPIPTKGCQLKGVNSDPCRKNLDLINPKSFDPAN